MGIIKEEKQLLLQDLCTRLPYGVKICVDDYICTLLDINTEMRDKLNEETFHIVGFNKSNGGYDFCTISEVKPYLRPMSSMTEEEEDEYDRLVMCNASWVVDDWLNKKHFDYRRLIPMGLALEAPEGMYKVC
jgi:hypothetical protein